MVSVYGTSVSYVGQTPTIMSAIVCPNVLSKKQVLKTVTNNQPNFQDNALKLKYDFNASNLQPLLEHAKVKLFSIFKEQHGR